MEERKRSQEIDWNTVRNILSFKADYNEESDILYLQSGKQCPAISVGYKGEIWFRVVPDSGEIVGVEIEDFISVFTKKHSAYFRKTKTYEARPIANFLNKTLAECPA